MTLKERKESNLYKEFEDLVNEIKSQSEENKQFHQVELDLYKYLLKLGWHILNYYFFLVGERLKQRGVPKDRAGLKMKNTGKRTRKYRSVFGILELTRNKYYSKVDKVHYVIDKELGLPQGRYSYVLCDWLSYSSTEMDFDQSVQLFKKILDQDLSGMQSSRLTYKLSSEVDDFYDKKVWEKEEEYLSLGIDGKGVPIIRSEIGREKDSTSIRLGKGGRKGTKKEATVCVSSSFTARKRNPEEIISALFRTEKLEKAAASPPSHKFHENKHMRAFVAEKIKGITYGIDNLMKRDPDGTKRIIVLVDGDRVLRNQVNKIMKEKGITDRLEACILDFIHVLEKVWKVANAYLGDQSKDRAAWVEKQARLILNGQLKKAIKEWKVIQGLKKYPITQAKNIKDAIRYCEDREAMMDYKSFLEKGFPITTGAVESACGHFVKSRMERNAMHWGLQGAQKMLDIRAVKKNGDWDQYVNQFILKEQARLYQQAA